MMVMKRRTLLSVAAGAALTLPLLTGESEASSANESDDFEVYRHLTFEQHKDLVWGWVQKIDRHQDGAMWSGRMCQNYMSVAPAALILGARSFDEVADAFSLQFLLQARSDERLAHHLQRRAQSALSVIPTFDEDQGLNQRQIFVDHFEFMASRFKFKLDLLKTGYHGSGRDMKFGRYDWDRVPRTIDKEVYGI